MNAESSCIRFAILCMGALIFTAQTASAATITVTSTADSGAGSLRQAIADAAAGDTIDFDVSLPNTILLTSGQLNLPRSVAIAGPGANQLALDANQGSQVMSMTTAGTTVSISGLTIQNGRTAGAGPGAGIYSGFVALTVSHCIIRNNNAVGGSPGGIGGGIFNDQGNVTVINSTVSGNNARGGGGLFNRGTMTVINSTFSGNTVSSGSGGAISSDFGGNNLLGPLTVINSTFSGNSAALGGGMGGAIYNSSPLTLRSTLFANNSPTNCAGDVAFDSQGDNISSDGSCVDTSIPLNDRNNLDPLLDVLADNGGTTQTFALQSGSPAIDAVMVNACPPPVTDQRGSAFFRPAGAACDIGAFELGAVAEPDLFANGFE